MLTAFSVLTSLTGGMPAPLLTRWLVLKGGSLQVIGSTNINKFTCSINGYSNADTITVYKNTGDNESVPLKGILNLDVSLFDCRNPVMTGDLRKTLKSKEYPRLKIKFLNLNKFPDLGSQTDYITGNVDIELAGVIKRFEVNYKFYRDREKTIHLIGERDVNFSDFNLTPPRKLGGMIKTDNKLKVQFELGMKSL